MSKRLVVWDRTTNEGRYLIFDDAHLERVKEALNKYSGDEKPEKILEAAGVPYTFSKLDPYSEDAFLWREIAFKEDMEELDKANAEINKAFGSAWPFM